MRAAPVLVLWAGLAGLAVRAEDAPASPCVVKDEGLRSPRRRLRYRGRLNEAQPFQLAMWQEFKRELEEGGEPQKQKGPCVTLDLEVTPERFEQGVTFFRVRIVKAGASGGTVTAEQSALLRKCVAALKGLLGEGAVAQDGSRADLRWEDADKLPPDAQGLAEQARVALADAFLPLPAVPMGEGGHWVVPTPGESTPGEPRIAEVELTCSVIGRAASVSASASAEAKQTVRMPSEPGAPTIVRDRVTTEVRRSLRLLPGRLFPAESATTTLTAHYTSGEARFVDRQSTEFRLSGPEEPEAPRVAVVGTGEDPKVPIEYSGTFLQRSYAVEYMTRETVAAEGRLEKRVQPRVRAVIRCEESSRLDEHVVGWSIEGAGIVDEAERRAQRGFADALKGLRGLEGGGAYGRSCEPVPGRGKQPRRMVPQMWLELPDDTSADVEQAAEQLCEAIEWSMLPLPETQYEPSGEEDGTEIAIVPEMGKGGAWRHEDLVPVAGSNPLQRIVEYEVTEAGEDSFVVSAHSSDGCAPLGRAALEGLPAGAKATLVACTSRRTGSWTIAKEFTMPRKANIEDVLDRDYEVVDPDGSKRTIRFHTVRTVTIEALDSGG